MADSLNTSDTESRSPQSGVGLLLIGHGTRDAEGVAEFQDLTRQVARALPTVAVEGCFLELAVPSIAEGVERLIARGARQVTAMPLLLLAAGHAKRDIPGALAQALAGRSDVALRITPHLGAHPSLLAASVRRFQETTAAVPPAGGETLLLLVGRGSTDAEANAELAHVARLRYELAPTAWYEVCFTTLAEPSLERGLAIAAALPMTRVVVQPHLLFRGRLYDRLRDLVAAQRLAAPHKEWLLSEPLGVCDELVTAILDRAGMAGHNVGQGSVAR